MRVGALRIFFHKQFMERQTDLDWFIWFLRIHDYGLGRLHIYELVLDLFYGFQGKFLRFFGFNRPASARGYGVAGK